MIPKETDQRQAKASLEDLGDVDIALGPHLEEKTFGQHL